MSFVDNKNPNRLFMSLDNNRLNFNSLTTITHHKIFKKQSRNIKNLINSLIKQDEYIETFINLDMKEPLSSSVTHIKNKLTKEISLPENIHIHPTIITKLNASKIQLHNSTMSGTGYKYKSSNELVTEYQNLKNRTNNFRDSNMKNELTNSVIPESININKPLVSEDDFFFENLSFQSHNLKEIK
jgi:hypothetical protein